MRFSSTVLIRNLGAIAMAFFVASCDAGRLTNPPESQPPAGEAVAAETVVISQEAVDMAVGDIMKLTASVYDRSGQLLSGRDVQWSTAASRAKINSDGTVEGVQVGVDTIFASMDGRTGKASLRIFVPKVAAIIVALSPTTIEMGGSALAKATLYDQHGDAIQANVYWTSTNTAVATVDQSGRVTTVAPGAARIRAVSEGKNDSENLTVIAAKAGVPASVAVTSPTSVLYVGKKAQLLATVRDGNGTVMQSAAVSWATSNANVGSVSASGEVTGVGAGTATFSATIAGKSGSTTLSVTSPPVNALTIALQPASITLNSTSSSVEGGIVAAPTSQAVVTTYDASGTVLNDRPVVYSSSNNTVATVSSTGVVAGLTAGTATITATSEGKSASAPVTVVAPAVVPVASLSVVLSSPTLQVGASTQALATPKDASGQTLTGRSVTWSSTNTSVATVSNSGLVTAVGPGTSSIRASSEGKTGLSTVTVVSPFVLSAIDISPASATLNAGEARNYTALGRNSDGSSVSVSVTWSATGGSITQQGNYTAGQIAGHFLVIAACACGVSDTSALEIVAPAPTPTLSAITVAPKLVTVETGDTVQISASGWMTGSSTPVSASVVWSATGGAVNQSGRYIAGTTAGTFYVRAQSTVDASKKDSTAVTITAPAAPPPSSDAIAALTVSPNARTMDAGTSYTFVANGWMSGSNTPVTTPVDWTATGGTVNQSGVYIAGNVAGTFVVRARSTTITWRVDSAIITITGAAAPPPPQPTVTAFSLTPSSVSLNTLGLQQFQTSATWSDGATRAVGVTYNVTGGGISLGGLFTAGLTGGTFRVIATCDCGKADTSVVTISVPLLPPPPPPSGSAQPFATDDYSSYGTLTQALSSSLYTGTQNSAQMALDNSGPPVGGKSIRYDFPDRSGEGTNTVDLGSGWTPYTAGYCTSYTISRSAPTPSGAKHVWAEVWVKFSSNFTTVAPVEWGCKSGNDYKFAFLTTAGYSRYSIQMQKTQWTMDLPSGQNSVNASNSPGKPLPPTFWDGQWHRYRIEAQLSTSSTSDDCKVRVWVDNTQLTDDYQSSGYVCDRAGFSALVFGANLNQGPKIPQSIWWGKWAMWTSNPGW